MSTASPSFTKHPRGFHKCNNSFYGKKCPFVIFDKKISANTTLLILSCALYTHFHFVSSATFELFCSLLQQYSPLINQKNSPSPSYPRVIPLAGLSQTFPHETTASETKQQETAQNNFIRKKTTENQRKRKAGNHLSGTTNHLPPPCYSFPINHIQSLPPNA